MKKIYLLALVSSIFSNVQSQTFGWSKREGRFAYDYGYGITTDNTGNVYVTGKYEEVNANFSGTLVPCAGNHDIFLAQYSASGALNWIRTAGGSSGDYGWGVAYDGANSIYIAGEIEGTNETIYFPGSTITLTCQASNDIFLAKYDLSGNLIWARSAQGPNYDKALSIAYDPTGNVYICGLYRGPVTFGGTTTIQTTGSEDLFIAKYDVNGNFLWVQHAGGSGRDEAKSIKCDAAGNIYLCGMYSQGCDFNGQVLNTYNNTAYFDAFIAKYSPSGSLTWVKTAGGDYDDIAWSLTMDNAGKIYAGGEFNAYAMFGSTPLTTNGNADIFVACYDGAGNTIWAKGTGGALIDRVRGIGCDGTNLFITGQFGSNVNFGSQTLVATDSSDIFFAALNSAGNFMGAASVGGAPDAVETLGYESGITICAESSGNVYAAGALLDGGIFGSTTLTTYGRTDAFVTKITQLTNLNSLVGSNGATLPYPNPSSGNFIIELNQPTKQKTETIIYNSLGIILAKRTDDSVSKIQLDLSEYQSGMYFVEIKTDNQQVLREKLIIKK